MTCHDSLLLASISNSYDKDHVYFDLKEVDFDFVLAKF